MSKNPYTLLARLMLPAVSKAVLKTTRAQTYAYFAMLACALERYHQTNGEFPERLEMLIPGFLPKLPGEIVSGEQFAYERLSPNQFVLTSTGWFSSPPDPRDDFAGEWTWRSGRQ
jgi:Tfp pilus assembly protein PilE